MQVMGYLTILNDTTLLSNSENDLFFSLMEFNYIKVFCLIFSCFGICILPVCLYSIIWYEKYGSDKKRTLLNMYATIYCWAAIEFAVLVQILETIRFMVGPLPVMVKHAQ